MVAARASGRGTYKLTWQGATVKRQMDADLDRAMNELASEIRSYLQATLHRITSLMANESFAEVSIRGGKRTLAIGSDAPYTLFHELRYHAQIREAVDTFAPRVTPAIQKAFQ